MTVQDTYKNLAVILRDNALLQAIADLKRKADRIKYLEKSLGHIQLHHSHQDKSFGSASLEDGYMNSNVVPGHIMNTVDLPHTSDSTKMQMQDIFMMELVLANVLYTSRQDANAVAMWLEPDLNYPEIGGGDSDDGAWSKMFNVMFTNNTKSVVLSLKAVDWDEALLTKLKTRILTCCSGAANYEDGMKKQSNLFRSLCSGFSSEFLDKTVEVVSISFRVRPIRELLEMYVKDEEHWADIQEAVRQDYRDISFNSIVANITGCPPPDTITI